MERRHLPSETSYPIQRPRVSDEQSRIGQVTHVSQQESELKAERAIRSSLPMTRPPQVSDRPIPSMGSKFVPSMSHNTVNNPFVPSTNMDSQGNLEKRIPFIGQPLNPPTSHIPMGSASHRPFEPAPPPSLSRFVPQESGNRETYRPLPPIQSMTPSVGISGPPQNLYQRNLASVPSESAFVPAPPTNANKPDTFEMPRIGMAPPRLQEAMPSTHLEAHVSPISREEEINLSAPPSNVSHEHSPHLIGLYLTFFFLYNYSRN